MWVWGFCADEEALQPARACAQLFPCARKCVRSAISGSNAESFLGQVKYHSANTNVLVVLVQECRSWKPEVCMEKKRFGWRCEGAGKCKRTFNIKLQCGHLRLFSSRNQWKRFVSHRCCCAWWMDDCKIDRDLNNCSFSLLSVFCDEQGLRHVHLFTKTTEPHEFEMFLPGVFFSIGRVQHSLRFLASGAPIAKLLAPITTFAPNWH